MSTLDKKGRPKRLCQILDELRTLQEPDPAQGPRHTGPVYIASVEEVAKVGVALLREAAELGAFGSPEYAHLRLVLAHPPKGLGHPKLPTCSVCAKLAHRSSEVATWDAAVRFLCPVLASQYVLEPLRPGETCTEDEARERADNGRDLARLTLWSIAPKHVAQAIESLLADAAVGGKVTGGGPGATVNARMLELLQKELERVSGWTAAQWANELRCARSTVVETPTWKDLAMGRQRQRAEKANEAAKRRQTKRRKR